MCLCRQGQRKILSARSADRPTQPGQEPISLSATVESHFAGRAFVKLQEFFCPRRDDAIVDEYVFHLAELDVRAASLAGPEAVHLQSVRAFRGDDRAFLRP